MKVIKTQNELVDLTQANCQKEALEKTSLVWPHLEVIFYDVK